MIRLKEIKQTGNVITADAYPESCKTAIKFVCHTDTWELEPYDSPENDEDYHRHMTMAMWHLKRLIKNGEKMPKERLIMWY